MYKFLVNLCNGKFSLMKNLGGGGGKMEKEGKRG